MRARRRRVQLRRVEALARHEAACAAPSRCACGRGGSERGWSRSTSQVWTYQCGSRRSIEYGSTVRVTTSCSSGFRYSSSTSLCPSIACVSVSTRPSSSPTCGVGRLREVERAERLLELRAHAVERRVRAGGDHRPDELEREPDRARLERRQPRRAAERVAEELLVDVHLVALQLGVDGVAAAAEVDEVEQREVLLELPRRGIEKRSTSSLRRDRRPRAPRRTRSSR